MELRVLENSAGRLLIAITRAELDGIKLIWAVPMLPAGDKALTNVDQRLLVSAKFDGKEYQVAYMHLRNLGMRDDRFKVVGNLDEQSSLSVMNSMFDLMDWG